MALFLRVSLVLLLCISAAAATSPAALLLGGHINSQDSQVKSSVSELVPAGKCSPPALPEGRAEISASVGESVIICGGMNKENPKGMASCIEWKMGSDQWVDKFTMRKARYGHQHWEPASRPGTLLLFGGWNEEENGGTTSGEEQPGGRLFTLAHPYAGMCGVPEGGSYIATGGTGSTFVTRYNATGSVVSELAALPEERRFHACALLGHRGKQMVVVAGGQTGRARVRASSVLSLELPGIQGSGTWMERAPIPAAVFGVRGATVGGNFLVSGGKLDRQEKPWSDQVHQYDFAENKWTTLSSKMKEARGGHFMLAFDSEAFMKDCSGARAGGPSTWTSLPLVTLLAALLEF